MYLFSIIFTQRFYIERQQNRVFPPEKNPLIQKFSPQYAIKTENEGDIPTLQSSAHLSIIYVCVGS